MVVEEEVESGRSGKLGMFIKVVVYFVMNLFEVSD